ncbi:MAG: alkyl hydroperoxide reductase [Marinilabiliales bacterium]|nr:MAG: alkyl hydroperoxide reductase [Marinilabiliales bacterium]
MNNLIKTFSLIIALTLSCYFVNAQTNLKVTLSGVPESKLQIYSIAEGNNNLIKEFPSVRNGEQKNIEIPEKYLPGEFILFFEYAGKQGSGRPQQAERMIIINKQNVVFFANPNFINNPDSSYFNESDIENKVLSEFANQTMQNLEMLDVIQTFILKYDNQDSDFYKSGIKEFQDRRKEHNDWIDNQLKEHKNLFCSNMFYFYYVPDVNWEGNIMERQQSLIDNYFTGMDFTNKNILRTSYLKSWMDNYVNKYIELATSQEMLTELFLEAGEKAIEESKKGDPYFYGWMVDYFFNGYEMMNIQEGITMLEKYTKDPNCMTYKRKEIDKRVTGIQNLTDGAISPDFTFKDESGKDISFHNYKTKAPYKLVLFWSADCKHCHALITELFAWHKNNKSKLEVFALSLDESDTEIPKWEKRIPELPGWIHILTQGGINSKEAESYYILSTPTMFLVDAKTNKIVASPMSFEELMKIIN